VLEVPLVSLIDDAYKELGQLVFSAGINRYLFQDDVGISPQPGESAVYATGVNGEDEVLVQQYH